MLVKLSKIVTSLILVVQTIEVQAMDGFCRYNPMYCSSSGNSVPELSATAGPIALAVLLGIVGIGIERRRRKNKK